MSVYRDDLVAAQQHINRLESEVERLRAPDPKNAVVCDETVFESPAQSGLVGNSFGSGTGCVVPLLAFGFCVYVFRGFSYFAPIIAAIVSIVVSSAILKFLRSRTLIVKPNEVAIVRSARKPRRATWVGPGRSALLRQKSTIQSLSLVVRPFSFDVSGIGSSDGVVDVSIIGVLAVRDDSSGIDLAVRCLLANDLTTLSRPIVERSASEVIGQYSTSSVVAHERGLYYRLQTECETALLPFGVALQTIGLTNVRVAVQPTSQNSRFRAV